MPEQQGAPRARVHWTKSLPDDGLAALAEASVVPESVWFNDDLVAHGRAIEENLHRAGYRVVKDALLDVPEKPTDQTKALQAATEAVIKAARAEAHYMDGAFPKTPNLDAALDAYDALATPPAVRARVVREHDHDKDPVL